MTISIAPAGPADPEYILKRKHERAEDDWYQEPSWAVHALFDAHRFMGSIYDPACGGGNVCKVAIERGFSAWGSDIADRGFGFVKVDFLGPRFKPHYQPHNIVMNPPFNLAQAFVERALEHASFKVAALMPLAFLESQTRQKFFHSTPLARVLAFTARVSMPPGNSDVKPSGGTKAFAWFIWSKDHIGSPTVGWCHRPKQKRDGA